ncbi:MAG: HAMP domain-containing histidine kinase, partial [Thermoproteota archaeon]|nr:HAMP domain-containing histidine kinase [Thermoproteota archaeon]
ELRTPIQPILGGAELIKTKATNNEQVMISDTIVRNARRLRKLADDILDVSKIESNTLKLNSQVFDLNELILDVVKEFSNINTNQKKKIWFETGGLNAPYNVVGDRNRIGQVLTNLIENSIKFASGEEEEDCVIYIGVKETSFDRQVDGDTGGNFVVVSIKDNGKGIDADMMPRLFTKFTSKSYQGTGLGLYISKSIIEAHGGKMWARNNDDGKGATFSFTLTPRMV